LILFCKVKLFLKSTIRIAQLNSKYFACSAVSGQNWGEIGLVGRCFWGKGGENLSLLIVGGCGFVGRYCRNCDFPDLIDLQDGGGVAEMDGGVSGENTTG
jgi:hypothetical protein